MGRGPSELQAQVLATDLCTACGACLGHCPYLKTLGERVAFIHPCPRDEGRCFEVCPRASLDPESLDRQVLGAPRRHPVLGGHDGGSPWSIVWRLVPGAGGIRAVGRLELVLLIPIGLCTALLLTRIGARNHRGGRLIAASS